MCKRRVLGVALAAGMLLGPAARAGAQVSAFFGFPGHYAVPPTIGTPQVPGSSGSGQPNYGSYGARWPGWSPSGSGLGPSTWMRSTGYDAGFSRSRWLGSSGYNAGVRGW